MRISSQIAKHLREVHTGGNWTWSNLKDNVEGLSWQEATTKVHSFNTIATLVFHMNYYVQTILKVLKGEPLTSKDEESFGHPPVRSQSDWNAMVERSLAEAEELARLIELMPDEKLGATFVHEKYGNYYRNLQGLIEHTHYHLGQIALIKKILKEDEKK